MLQEVVTSALGPTPPSKRKLPSKEDESADEREEQRCPNVQAAVSLNRVGGRGPSEGSPSSGDS